ncbi:universal stress protein [Geoalkalibacter halelectricus]|uniref:universal stress protein n=1 Tax=Geoalkalibacter halelectricus TaxID=2847045 RepID=UPI003D1D2107
MFERLIVATDLSPASYAVVSCLAGLRAYGAEQCLLLQCLSYRDATSVALSYHSEPLEEMLNEQKDILQRQGFVVEERIVAGSAKREITRIAQKEDYDLIVVGAQGHSLLEEKILGGVAYGVMNRSTKPVLVVPVERKPGEENSCKTVARCNFVDHVLFATDFSQMADNAFSCVEQLVAAGAKKVTLVHVQDKTLIEPHLRDRLEEFIARDQERLAILKQALVKAGTSEIDIKVCYGTPYLEITRLVREQEAHLVVMGTQGRGFVGETFLGSVSHNVVRHSIAPVLLIPSLS